MRLGDGAVGPPAVYLDLSGFFDEMAMVRLGLSARTGTWSPTVGPPVQNLQVSHT